MGTLSGFGSYVFFVPLTGMLFNFKTTLALTILFSTWSLLKDSLRLSLDGVPTEMNLQQVKEAAIKIEGVKEIHHIHLWGMSTTENALTAHIVIDSKTTLANPEKIKHELKHQLEYLNIHHITLETESKDCHDEKC